MKNGIQYVCMALALLAAACDSGGAKEKELPPRIVFEGESGVYPLKTGRSLTFRPVIENDAQGQYTWMLDGQTVGHDRTYAFTAVEPGSFFLTFRVVTPYGKDEEEVRIDVSESTPPVISFGIPADGFYLPPGTDYTVVPAIAHAEGASYRWELDGKSVAQGTIEDDRVSYTFRSGENGAYRLTLHVSNEDGRDEKSVLLIVTDRLPLNVWFDRPMFTNPSTDVHLFEGQPACLSPVVEGGEGVSYRWFVDGAEQAGQTGPRFVFTSAGRGGHDISVLVNSRSGDSVMASVRVVWHGPESAGMRTAGNRAGSDRVYEYIPAPGQFINGALAGFTSDIDTHEKAVSYAEKRLKTGGYVSLGGFGGFIVVGFDHSIRNAGTYQGYDLAIAGNQFDGDSEPGIVWVMQDANGNGLPDDVWYELRGSETGKPETIQDYAVTYTRPGTPRSPVPWRDNRGASGQIDYMGSFDHTQDTYYPAWIDASTYTLRGTRVYPQIENVKGKWHVGALTWGYADNFGEDRADRQDNPEANPGNVYFKIANAIRPDGAPAELRYIDFVKVQTGAHEQVPVVGEVSTEVFSFTDLGF